MRDHDNPLFLAVDIGNSEVKLGLFEHDRIVLFLRSPTDAPGRASDRLREVTRATAECGGSVIGAAVCSVVPDVAGAWTSAIDNCFGIRPFEIGSDADIGLRIMPQPPQSVGRDRLVTALAAYEAYGGPTIVVNLGTATTVDAVSHDGAFLGGAIAPGPATAANALFRAGAQLPAVPLTAPGNAIGRSTVEAMQSGTVLGYAGLVDGLVTRMRHEMGSEAKTLATGGWSDLFTGICETLQTRDPNLTLDGIRRVWLRNR